MSDGSPNDELERLREMVAHLTLALESRDVIGQAKGVLIAVTGCTAERAFAVLVAQSQSENRKLIEVAREIVFRAERGAAPTRE